MAPTNDQVRSAIAQQAADWYVANRAGPLPHEEARAFAQWLRLSPIHVEEYLATADVAREMRGGARLDVSLDALVAEGRADIAHSVAPIAHRPRPVAAPPERGWFGWGPAWLPRAAAATVLLLGVAVLWQERTNWLGVPAEFESGIAEQRTTTLPDGSTLFFDAKSAAKVRFLPSTRAVYLLRGRVHFSVAHDSRRPFRVFAGSATIVAVGTEFDVDRLAQATIVTVTEGRVVVGKASTTSASAPGAGEASAVAVGAGERVRVAEDGTATRDRTFRPESAAAWRQGKFVFVDQPLREVVEEFNRYDAVPIEVDDPDIASLRISGVFDRGDTESFVLFLQTLEGVAVKRTAQRITLMRAAPRPHEDIAPRN